MKITYLSYFIDQKTPVYGGAEDKINISSIRSISNGDNTNEMQLNFPNHIGTHIDFPYHFSSAGKKINDYKPSFWVFNNVGFIESDVDNIDKNSKVLSNKIEILIIKTNFGNKRLKKEYWKSQPVIQSKLADILKKRFPNLRVLGFDLISLTSKLNREEGKKAHISFLIKNDILILEDMKLNELMKKPEKIIISPLLINYADGSPCNVISFENES